MYRAVDKEGNTIDFLLRAHRDKAAARRYFEKSIEQNGEPETVTIGKSGANLAALDALNAERDTPIKIRQRKYLATMLQVEKSHVPFPDEPPLEQIYNDLLIGDVETVAEKLVGEIRATHPVHMCFSFKVGATPHKAAMRSMELMMTEVKPRVERALGSPAREAAE